MVLWELLSEHLSLQLAAVLAGVYGVYKVRRLRSIAGALVGVAGTGAFAVSVLIGGFALAIALGWLDLSAMLADVTQGINAAWDTVGRWLVDRVTGVLP